ncbi:PIN domain protein [uncultured archaeon]|nr:PIN domain protein [uncultured archaeon]
MRASTSVLVLNEVLHYFSKNYSPQAGLSVFSNIRKTPNLGILGVQAEDLELVAQIVKVGLDATDAYHAAVLQSNGIDTICSYDKGFDKVKTFRRQEPD